MQKRFFKNIKPVIFLLLLFFSCDGTLEDMVNGISENAYWDIYNLSIGDTGPGGGLVFYINPNADRDGWKYMEVSPVDLGTNVPWSNDNNSFVNGSTALPTGIGTGFSNTNAIIAHDSNAGIAAKICRNYRADEEGDWFLPSKDELNLIWVNLVDDGNGNNSGVGDFKFLELRVYWSSSEKSYYSAWTQYFGVGHMQADYNKYLTEKKLVRAVRAF